MKHILFLALLLAAFPSTAPAQEKITRATCDADLQAMFDEAERNRVASLLELESQLRRTTDDDHAGALSQQIDQTWEMEERFRNIAAIAHRDCIKYVESGGS